MIRALLLVDRWVRVEPLALTLSMAVDVLGAAADTSAGIAERAAGRLTRYAETARLVGTLSRCTP